MAPYQCVQLATLLLAAAPLAAQSRTNSNAVDRAEEFTEARCAAVVSKVRASGQYSEESIVPVCNEEFKSTKCDFFAEALSLASSHEDFNGAHFCANMAKAHFCSKTMDKLLVGLPLSDLAYGECLRANSTRGPRYCQKFRRMLGYAVENDDLDTIRACYMMEAYTNMGNASLEDAADHPDSRIIASGSNDVQSVGFGNTTKHSTVGQSEIVLQPQPFDKFGRGNGSLAPQAAAEPQQRGGTIVTQPVPASLLARTARLQLIQTQLSTEREAARAGPIVLRAAPLSPIAGDGVPQRQTLKLESGASHRFHPWRLLMSLAQTGVSEKVERVKQPKPPAQKQEYNGFMAKFVD